MKAFLTLAMLLALVASAVSASRSVQGKTLREINVIPQHILKRSVSPKFFKSLLVSPLDGWITVRANLSGGRLLGPRVTRSDLKGIFDPLALQLAKEAKIAGNNTIERPHLADSVLLHLLVYEIADATMVLSFAHLDGPGGEQADYYGCARLLILKDDKWTEIQGPDSLHGKGWAIRQGAKDSLDAALRTERLGTRGAESTNMDTGRR